ncbi:hypothetical protein [Rivibacter subsaxonicus]|uniref:Uncharacterized protein n=1 Tax=Rivibacter subsaxonicus TaxID=457575 RepID=A0A4Q7VZH2_9BURK|nr:hypothetical protein [Rivibacter subsaxonicus]RZU02170.1 hypothetical protein EV670_0191 [Rivibacter subsaxonicus]
MLPLRLESPDALPAGLASRLVAHRALFRMHEFLDSVLEHTAVRAIADELEAHLSQQRIHGYHSTKEPVPGFFVARGLRPTDVETHQAEFLAAFGDRFTETELAEMKVAWHEYFVQGGQRRHRNGLVWACLSRSLAKTSGTETFYRYFGGEAVFMPLKNDSSVAAKLEAIGQPVVVEVSLPGAVLEAQHPMAMAVLSHYHRTIRPDAHLYESEARLRQAVPAADVIRVTQLHEFQP